MSAINRLLLDSTGAAISGAKTTTFTSESLRLYGMDVFGISLDIGTVSGTSPTLNPKIDWSFDNGVIWLASFPADVNSDTQAALTEITGTTEKCKFWTIPFGVDKDPTGLVYPLVRVNFVIAGTDPSFTFTSARVIARRFDN